MWLWTPKRLSRSQTSYYALPPADFTRERDERAKALRREKRRDEADAVKGLRKPTLAAWALNQLARRRAKEVERLLAAGEELRRAQDELLAGGDRKAFQSAATKEREQVAKLADEATGLVTEAGERAGPALPRRSPRHCTRPRWTRTPPRNCESAAWSASARQSAASAG